MTDGQWEAFASYRDSLKSLCAEWNSFTAQLEPLQREAAAKDTPPYPMETAVVYNSAYDEVTHEDEIKLIVIGDNPGKEEQLAKNRRYLVGQSGRIADGFFRRNEELGVDFRRNVIIMNKTPVHTAKTSHLKYLLKNGGSEISALIAKSQVMMAELAADLHKKLVEFRAEGAVRPELWLVGYAELKNRGLFLGYRDALKNAYGSASAASPAWDDVYVYQHFSMNRFLIDLRDFRSSHDELSLKESLRALGHTHRDEIFGSL